MVSSGVLQEALVTLMFGEVAAPKGFMRAIKGFPLVLFTLTLNV